MRCIVSHCKHDTRTTSKSQGITFHVLPTKPSLRTAWLKALGKEGGSLHERSAICSTHFLAEDLYVTKRGLRKIKAGAVPVVMQNGATCNDLVKPSDAKVCRICFATDCKLYPMTVYTNLCRAYETLTGVSVKTDDNLPPYVCMECARRLLNSIQLRMRSLRAHLILLEIAKKNDYITLETVQSIKHKQDLLSSNLTITHNRPDHYDLEVKHVDKEPVRGGEEVHGLYDERVMVDDVKREEAGGEGDVAIGDDIASDDNVYADTLVDVSRVDKDPAYTNEHHGLYDERVVVEEVKREELGGQGDECDSDDVASDDKVYADAFAGKDYSSDDSQPLGRLRRTAKRRGRHRKASKPSRVASAPPQPKVDRRRKPFLNDDLSQTLFTIADLTIEEQLAEIEKRQETSNYKNALFKCTVCYKGFLDRNAFDSHMTRHTNQCGEHKCEICKTHFKHSHALRKHITAHHTQRFSCNQCPYVTTHRQTARLHERWHKGTKYKCPHCDDEFLKFTTYMGHVRIKHPSDFVCSLCGYCFVSQKGIELHKKLKHRLDTTQVPEDGPLCELCNVKFVSAEAYKRHLSVSAKHNTEKPTKERKEMKLRKPRSSPRRNVRTSSADSGSKMFPGEMNSAPIPCEQCGLQLEDSRAYHGHFRRMHPDKNRTNYPSMKSPCMCEVCGRMFQSYSLLKDHRWTHTGERPFACSACGKCFRMRQRLVAHRRVHDQTKATYCCSLCGKHFSTHSNRQRHMIIHTGLKPFKCEMCGKSFKHASEKRAHITYVHLKKPWPKRSRGKRRTDGHGQMQPQGSESVGASQMEIAQPMWPPCDPKMPDVNNMITDKAVYYNMKI